MRERRCEVCGCWFANLPGHVPGCRERPIDGQSPTPKCPAELAHEATHCTHLWADNPRRYFCPTCSRIFGADVNRWGDTRWDAHRANGPLAELDNHSVAQPVA